MADDQNDASKETARPSGQVRKRLVIKPKPVTTERGQSTISFPYMDLEAAVSVARGMLSGGGVPLSRDQLAGVMNLAAGSGNFVQKVATARVFGLISFSGGKYELTNLGFSIVDSDERRQKAAKAEAFLNVPLYKRTYEEFRGKQLPPRPHGLEQAFAKFGVALKQKTNARLAFDKSAAQAGFFPNGSDRLIEPILGGVPTGDRNRSVEMDEEPAERPTERAQIIDPGLHPFIQGLLDTLPEPQTNWTVEGRAKWLQAAANIFDLIYKGSGNIQVTAQSTDSKNSLGT